MIDLFNAYKDLAESLDDKARLGMFYGWLGFAMWARGKAKDSYEYLCKALEIGEEIEDQQVIGYACTWLTWTCLELDLLDKAITFGERAQKIYKSHESDQYIYFKSLCGLGLAYCYKGESKKCFEAGKALLEYGQNHANIRSLVTGHSIVGGGHFSAGDFPSTIESLKRAIQVRADPIYCQTARMYLGLSYFINDQLLEAEEAFKEVEAFSRDFGTEWVGTPAQAFLGIIFIAKGQMNQGLRMVEDAQREFVENGRKWFLALSHYAMGKLYLQIVEGSSKVSFSVALKNIGFLVKNVPFAKQKFLVKNVPFAKQKAAVNLNKTIEIAQEIGAKSLLGMAYLDLGLLHKAKGEKDKARECITTAMQFFEQCEAEVFLQQAKEALESL